MAIGMQKRKRGIFGGSSAPTMPQGGADYGAMEPGLGMQQQQQKPGLGTRLLGEGWEGKVSAIGSALQGNFNAIPDHHAQQQAIQQQAAQQAEMLRRQSLQLQNQMTLHDYKREKPLPTGLERDIGTLGGLGYTQEQAVDRLRPEQIQVVPLPGGRTYVGPNRGLGDAFGDGKSGDRPKIGATVSMESLRGGQSTQGETITRQQYQGMVEQMGEKRTQDWLSRSGVRVSN